MRHMKKYASILLALVMALALAVPALAAGNSGTNKEPNNTGKITIDNAIVGQTYTIYKIFDLESYSNVTETTGNYSYKITEAWKGFFPATAEGVEATLGSKYVTVDPATGYVTGTVANIDAAAFAKAALTWAKDNSISNAGKQENITKATDDGITDKNITKITFGNLALGYYLVDSSAGALCSLDTTDSEVTIHEKNTVPTLDKQVQEGTTWGETNDAGIGDTVNFQVTIHAKAGAENYVLHDKMTAGLTFGSVTGITYSKGTGDTATTGNLTENSDYTVTNTDLGDGCTFEVTFTQSWLDTNVTADTDIVVSYTATVNENAKIATNENTNEAQLKYGDGTATEWKKTTTYVWEFDILKFYKDTNNEETPLAGAKFTLSESVNGEAIKFVSAGNTADTPAIPIYRVAKTGEASTVTEIETGSTGRFNLVGLDAGTYYLTETVAPIGYNKLAGPVQIKIDGTADAREATTENPAVVAGTVSTVTKNDNNEDVTTAATDKLVKVENKTGTELPETGGMGTKIFYAVGSVMALGAVVLLVTKRRMGSK